MNTTEQVHMLAATGEYETMKAIAEKIGVTRERVRQIIRAENIPWQDSRVQLRWDCPGCGAAISVARSAFYKESSWNYMPAHCRTCSKRNRKEFCKRGHLRVENRNAHGACRACTRAYNRCVVETHTCVDCGMPLKISRGMQRQINIGNTTGKRCRRCQMRRALRIRWVQRLERFPDASP